MLSQNKQPQWHRNMMALWVGNFATGAGASMSLPFLPLFISTMGHFPKWELSLYAGMAFAATFLSQAIVSPLWGKLADRTGRKPMLLRAAIGMTVTSLITGLSTNVWMLITLRLIQGGFSGYINNAYALVASEVPREKKWSDDGNADDRGGRWPAGWPDFRWLHCGFSGVSRPVFLSFQR